MELRPEGGPLVGVDVAGKVPRGQSSGAQDPGRVRARDSGGVLNDPVQVPATSGEDATDEALVWDLLVDGDERLSAPGELKQAAVDARTGRETPGGHACVEVEAEPGGGLRGHQGAAADGGAFAGDLPLREQDRVRPCAGVQQASQERGGEVEGDVADDHRAVKRVGEGIDVFHRDIGQLSGEAARAVLVELDGGESTSQLRQGCCQCVARAPRPHQLDLEDAARVRDVRVDRSVLQPHSPAHRARQPQPRGVRTTSHPRRNRGMINKEKPSGKPGQAPRSLGIPNYANMGQLYTPSATQYIPHSISYKNGGSVDLSLDVGELRPRGTYVSEDEEIVLVVADRSLTSIRGTWELTARDHNDVYAGEIDVAVAGDRDLTAVARGILRLDDDAGEETGT